MNDREDELIVEVYVPEVADPEDKDITPRFKMTVYWGSDGTPVLEIDTSEMNGNSDEAPICRVYLNDGIIYENPPLEKEG